MKKHQEKRLKQSNSSRETSVERRQIDGQTEGEGAIDDCQTGRPDCNHIKLVNSNNHTINTQ